MAGNQKEDPFGFDELELPTSTGGSKLIFGTPGARVSVVSVVPASIFDELSAATPSWSGASLISGAQQMSQVERDTQINNMATSMILNITNRK